MFLSAANPRKPKTKESEVRSHERSEGNQTEDLSLSLSLTPTTEEDLEAETSPDLIEGDIAISKVSGEIPPVCVYAEF